MVSFQKIIKPNESFCFKVSEYLKTIDDIPTLIPDKDFPEERVKDILSLSRWIKKQRWNKDKIGIIGFSYGGAGTNLLANDLELQIMREFKKKDKELYFM